MNNNNNNNIYNRHWKKRKKQGEPTTLPFTRIKENDRLLFVVDDYKWTLGDINRWLKAFWESISRRVMYSIAV